MKRKTERPITITLRDTTGGELLHAARVAAAKLDMSMNTWLLHMIAEATENERREGE